MIWIIKQELSNIDAYQNVLPDKLTVEDQELSQSVMSCWTNLPLLQKSTQVSFSHVFFKPKNLALSEITKEGHSPIFFIWRFLEIDIIPQDLAEVQNWYILSRLNFG